MLPTMLRGQPDFASIRTRYYQGDGMFRMISLIDRFFIHQFDVLERLQKPHDCIRRFQESELLCP